MALPIVSQGVVVLGVLASLLGLFLRYRVKQAEARHAALVAARPHVEGVVARNHKRESSDDVEYVVVIEYTVNGIRYQIDRDGTSRVEVPTGEPSLIAYNPALPSDAVEVHFNVAWEKLLATLMCVGGLILSALAAAGLLE